MTERSPLTAEDIRRALNATDGNVAAAARLLGVNRTALHGRMRDYGIRVKRRTSLIFEAEFEPKHYPEPGEER